MKKAEHRIKNRELSWLSFNHRVLQEAADPRVPLYERIKFLAIFSSNLDEFFRVRVAALRAVRRLRKKTRKQLDFDPAKVLKRIHKVVEQQQEEFGRIFRLQILKELARHKIYLINETQLTQDQREIVRTFALREVVGLLSPHLLTEGKKPPFLNNRSLYLVVQLEEKSSPESVSHGAPESNQIAMVEIPTPPLQRFFLFPGREGRHYVMFLDDVVRLVLPQLFPHHEVGKAYSVKLTRDAELHFDEEFADDLVKQINKALSKREIGEPSRFLYDLEMPRNLLDDLVRSLDLQDDDLVLGGRYHNFHDLFHFPSPFAPELTYGPFSSLPHRGLGRQPSLLKAIEEKDFLLFFPYHSYEPILRMLAEAAEDPRVASIHITLYRVARDSQVVKDLLRAARNGKSVTAVVELKARFDEESNIHWAEQLEQAGVKIIYGFPGLKVHAKLCLISMVGAATTRRLAYLSTGNFNEKTAQLYSDFGYFTSREYLTEEVARVFDMLSKQSVEPDFKYLLVAPLSLRKGFLKLIRQEIENARKGEDAAITIKVNSLEDREMIEHLYRASRSGVSVRLIVRGICCLVPGIKGTSDTIEAISLVDRFLEHARVFIFQNAGKEICYLSSADWMTRNLSYRIEVAFPIHDPDLLIRIKSIMQLQLNDTVKARIINRQQDNRYRSSPSDQPLRSQTAIYDLLKNEAVPGINLD